MRQRIHLFIALVFACTWMAAPQPNAGSAHPVEVRALWVAHGSLTSQRSIVDMIQAAKAAGFNTLLVQVRARGDAYYASRIEPRAEALAGQPPAFDPLAVVLAEGHRAGLRVHAWVAVNLVSSAVDLPASRVHVVYRHPEWLMVPRGAAAELRAVDPRAPRYLAALARACRRDSGEVEGLYLSPVDPVATGYLARVIGDIATRYPVDGVHLDYIRYPNDEFDYSRRALSLFADEVTPTLSPAEARRLRGHASADPFAYVDRFPERWRQFRRERLTSLVVRLREVVKANRPHALLTAAVLPDATEAARLRLQEWQRWAAAGTIDVLCPMAYAADVPGFTAQLEAAGRAAGNRPLWAGIGAYRLSPAQTIESIRIARRHGAAGIVLFSYDSLIGSPPDHAALSLIGRAAFE